MFNVLVVDDEPEIRSIIQDMLETDGRFRVTTASNGTDALRMCREDHPDVVLLDAIMPGMDGFRLCKLLKRDPETAGTKAVMLTTLTQKVSLTEAFESGADRYETKLSTPKQILASVEKVLGIQRDERSTPAGARGRGFDRGDRVALDDGRRALMLNRVPPGQWAGDGWGYRLELDEGGHTTVESSAVRPA